MSLHANPPPPCTSQHIRVYLHARAKSNLACVSGMIVGGLGGCCGTIRPRRVDAAIVAPLLALWCREMSPAERSDMTPVPSPQFGWAVVKQTRPPCEGDGGNDGQYVIDVL